MKPVPIVTTIFLLSTIASSAFAEDPAEQTEVAAHESAPATPAYAYAEQAPAPKGPPRWDGFRVRGGVRADHYSSSGLQGYAPSETIPQFSIEGTHAFQLGNQWSFATGLAWDVGGRTDKLRGLEASVTTHRLTVPIEARFHVLPWLLAFGRVAPGANASLVSVQDASAPAALKGTAWTFATDLSAGAAFLVTSKKNLDRRTARVWITPEFGYAWASDADVRVTPNRDGPLGSDSETNLGSIARRGWFWRAAVAVSF